MTDGFAIALAVAVIAVPLLLAWALCALPSRRARDHNRDR
jgi:hypothetical protein